MTWIALIVVVAAAFAIVLPMFLRGRLSAAAKARLRGEWSVAISSPDANLRVLEADTVVARLLDGLGYKGSMGEKLKTAAKTIPELDAVWAAHKLRNRVAHEPGLRLTEEQARLALEAFERVLNKFA